MYNPIILNVNRPTFEEKLPIIDGLLAKKRNKWTLTAVSYMDWDDAAQIIRFHIYKKWDAYDPTKPLENWVSTIITNQVNNLLRNNYLYVAPPCSRCPMNQGAGLCGFTPSGFQCSACPLYKKWEVVKKAGFNIKLAQSIHDMDSEASFKVAAEKPIDWEMETNRFHSEMFNRLPKDLVVPYELLYIKHEDEASVAKALGFKSSETGRTPGYKQIYNIKKKILEIAREVAVDIKNEDY